MASMEKKVSVSALHSFVVESKLRAKNWVGWVRAMGWLTLFPAEASISPLRLRSKRMSLFSGCAL